MTLQERIERKRAGDGEPARLLALDGGGIRGLITLGYLKAIEDILRARHGGSEAFRLRDHYDLIGGTSTGSIIAAGLAIGMTVDEITKAYLELGKTIFGKPNLLARISAGLLAPKFDGRAVSEVLESILGTRRLDAEDLTTGLCVVTKRYDTNSVWPVVNAPQSLYFDHSTQPNRDFPLSSIVRASTAAPTYFEPERITLGPATYGFIDGGVSLHNNPASLLFKVATLPGFGFDWPVGPEKMKIVSIGTGDWSRGIALSTGEGSPIKQVPHFVGMFMEEAAQDGETFMQAFGTGNPANRRVIDSTIGKLTGQDWGVSLFGYERYEVELTQPFFDANGLSKLAPRIDRYREMDNVQHMDDLLEIGTTVAALSVRAEDIH